MVDYCSKCGAKINDEDYIEDYDIEEYWGAKVRRWYIIGYSCPICGYKELL